MGRGARRQFSRKLWEARSDTEIVEVAWVGRQWGAFEEAYGRAIPLDVQLQIHDACTDFLRNRDAEMNAPEASDAVVAMKRVVEAIETFERFAHAQMSDGSDAGRAVAYIVRSHLDQVTVPLNPDDLLQADAAEDDLPGYFTAGSRPHAGVKLSPEFLSNMSVELTVAMQAASDEVDQKAGPDGPGFDRGYALKTWILQMRGILSEADLPIASLVNGHASNFARLMFRLHRSLPCDLRGRLLASEDAMGEHMKKVVSDHLAKERSSGGTFGK